jgi:predicted alpha/beta superfamily hydrolase
MASSAHERKIRMRFLIPLLLLSHFICMPGAYAQQRPATLPGTEVRTLHSELLDRDFELYVKLPWSYRETEGSYPVLFTLDANRTFPLYATTSSVFETPGGGGAREVVVVGIAYKVSESPLEGLVDWATWRRIDFEPRPNPEADAELKTRLSTLPGQGEVTVESGEADAFLGFLLEEAVPFVEANYRVSVTDRSLAGYSLGGLFVLYTFFQAPEAFTTYLAGDPSMRDLLLKLEADQRLHRGVNARLLVVTAEKREAVETLVQRLRSRGDPGLDVRLEVLENEDHMTAGPAAISRMLRLVHQREAARLTDPPGVPIFCVSPCRASDMRTHGSTTSISLPRTLGVGGVVGAGPVCLRDSRADQESNRRVPDDTV